MKKLLKFVLSIFCIVALVCVGFVGYRGFKEYEQRIQMAPIEQMIAQIEADPYFTPYEDIPHELIRATVSIEDHRFFDHRGVDYIGLTRAIVSQIFPGYLRSGGSTITQQLAKNMYEMWEPTLDRKASEFFFAKALERKYSKQDIITYYLNVINYGDGYIGIRQASRGYFYCEPEDLSIPQATLLAEIPQSPMNYQLSDHFDQAKEKQRVVLEKMVECDYLHEEDVDVIWNQPVY